jgi:hypothetical protein
LVTPNTYLNNQVIIKPLRALPGKELSNEVVTGSITVSDEVFMLLP